MLLLFGPAWANVSPSMPAGFPVFVQTMLEAECLVSNQAPVGAVAYQTYGFNFEALCSIVLQRGEGLTAQLTACPNLAWETKHRSGIDFKQTRAIFCWFLLLLLFVFERRVGGRQKKAAVGIVFEVCFWCVGEIGTYHFKRHFLQ